MRFRHLDPVPVLNYLRSTPATILVREWERQRTPAGIAGLLRRGKPQMARPGQPGTVGEVEFIARRRPPSEVGVVLRFFFHVGSSSAEPILPLVEAVAHVERVGAASEFLLAGHPDGGLISVSRESLSFQQGLEPITWWGP
jgi:hypothetical protein